MPCGAPLLRLCEQLVKIVLTVKIAQLTIGYPMVIRDLIVLIAEELGVDESMVKPAAELAQLPNWDSMSVLGLLAGIDEKFDLQLDASRLAACKTVADLWRVVDEAGSGS